MNQPIKFTKVPKVVKPTNKKTLYKILGTNYNSNKQPIVPSLSGSNLGIHLMQQNIKSIIKIL